MKNASGRAAENSFVGHGIRPHLPFALLELVFLAHAGPDIGVDDVGVAHGGKGIDRELKILR